MKRVTSLGGIFFKSRNPAEIKEWYKKHLGFNTDEYGTTFVWRHNENPEKKGFSVWSPFASSTEYFKPSEKDFMVNFRVENIDELVKVLKEEGVNVVDEIEVYEYGKFVHILDNEGNKIELWEPNDDEYDKISGAKTF